MFTNGLGFYHLLMARAKSAFCRVSVARNLVLILLGCLFQVLLQEHLTFAVNSRCYPSASFCVSSS